MIKSEVNLKRKLSKGILEMKFMKRTKDKEEKQKEVEESQVFYADQITKEMKFGGEKFIVEPSIARCKDLIDGRLSFQGMNLEIERQMELDKGKGTESKKCQQDAEVSDAEMANYSLHTNDAVAKKFMTKSERKNKRPRFMKPDD